MGARAHGGLVTVGDRLDDAEDLAPRDYTIPPPLTTYAGCVGLYMNRMWRNVAATVMLHHDKACSAAMEGIQEWPPLLPITQADYLVEFSRRRDGGGGQSVSRRKARLDEQRQTREQAKKRHPATQSKRVAGRTGSEAAAYLRAIGTVEQRRIAGLRRQLVKITAKLEQAEERLRLIQHGIDIVKEPESLAR